MNSINNTFAHAGIPEGQTHAPLASSCISNCIDKISSEKMKKLFGKAIAMAILFLFAVSGTVSAQHAVTTGTTITNSYIPLWQNTANPWTIQNSQIIDNGTTGGSGGIGINTTSTSSYLNMAVPHVNSASENCYSITVDDASGDYFAVNNSTTANGTFAPAIIGHIESASNRIPLFLAASCNSSFDCCNNTNPMMIFDSRQTSAAITTRPLFQWSNFGTVQMLMDHAGNLGIGTTTPTYPLSLGGTAGQTIWMERNPSSALGQGLTLSSGGATQFTTNLAGGDLYLKSGISTGTGTSALHFFTATAGASGSSDNSPTEKMTILGSGFVGIGATSPTNILSLGGNIGQTIWMERNATTFGQGLTLSSGGAATATSNSAGGDLTLKSGISTGSGSSAIHFVTDKAGASGSSDNTLSEKMTIDGTGHIGINQPNPATLLDMVSLSNGASSTINIINSSSDNIFTLQDNGILRLGSSTTSARLDVEYSNVSNANPWAIYGNSTTTATASASPIGVKGEAGLPSGAASCFAYGVYGNVSTCGSSGSGNKYYGVYGSYSCSAGGTPYGVYCNGNGGYTGTWTLVSDIKLKDNIQPMAGALQDLMKLQPKTYTFRTSEFPGMNLSEGTQMGLISQDVEKVYPNLVRDDHAPATTDKNGNIIYPAVDYKGLNYTGFIPVIISALQQQQDTVVKQQTIIQQQQAQITASQTQNAQLQSSVNDLQSKYSNLQAQNGQLQSSMSDLQNQFSSVLAEIEQLKTLQAECCGSVGANSTTGSSNASNNADQPSLAQNVPNPFTQNTVINYYLPANMPNAIITIRSMSGTTLKSFNISTAGNGQINVSQGILAPATYEYDMIVNGKLIDSKKMVIIGQ